MTEDESETQPIPGLSATIALSIVVALLLLTGCGFTGAIIHESIPPKVAHPTPPLQPALFADFDTRTYVPDRIVIPSIELDTSVVDVGWNAMTDSNGRVVNSWDVADFAAGWHVNSDQLGQGGNVVLSGHNNLRGAVFQELDLLEAGDVATIWSGDIGYDYEIDSVIIVPERDAPLEQRRENAHWIGKFNDNRLTLISCWPRNGNSHRIIAVGHYVGDVVGNALASTTIP